MTEQARAAISLLVIDDNPRSVELASDALAQPGLEILTAAGPEEGLDLFTTGGHRSYSPI